MKNADGTNTTFEIGDKVYYWGGGIEYGGNPIIVLAEIEEAEIGYFGNIQYGIVFGKGTRTYTDKIFKTKDEAINFANNYINNRKSYLSNNSDIRYEVGGEVLLAPNGKPSNLTPEQYKLVHTPEFKAWFGDWEKAYETGNYDNVSKVIDEETKEPLVVYRGSRASTQNVSGLWLSKSKSYAEGFGDIMQYFVKIIKPMPEYLFNKTWMVDYDLYDGRLGDFHKIVVKYPNQIKLADGTNTTFDYNNPDIRYEKGGYIRAIKKIYKDGDEYVYGGKFGLKGTINWRYNPKNDYLYLIGIERNTDKSVGEGTKAINYLFELYPKVNKIIFEIDNYEDKNVWKFYDKIGATEEGNGKLNKNSFFAELTRKSFYKKYYMKGGEISEQDKKETYKKWKDLVNMSASELKKFMDSDEGKEAGLSKQEADKLGIHYGRESAKWILKMKDTPNSEWTPEMWRWAKRQISFNSRMRGNKGKLYDDKGRKTRKHLSLLIWGHNPEKYEMGGGVEETEYGIDYDTYTIANLGKCLKYSNQIIFKNQKDFNKKAGGTVFPIYNSKDKYLGEVLWGDYIKLLDEGKVIDIDAEGLVDDEYEEEVSKYFVRIVFLDEQYADGGEINLTSEQVEQKLGRKLHWWKDDVVSINGVEYKKVFLKSEYKRLYALGGEVNIENPSTDKYNEIFINGEKVGYIILSPARKEYYWLDINLPNPLAIVDIKILKEFRGKNYMTQTMNWLFNFAKENGHNSLFLRVDDNSEISQETLYQIYSKYGFSTYKTSDDDDDIFMYKLL